MINNSELNKLQDLFTRIPEEAQDLIFSLLQMLASKNSIPQGENIWDLENNSGLEQIKKSNLIKENKLDNFKEQEADPVIVSKVLTVEEQEDIKQFEADLLVPDVITKNSTISEPKKKKERNLLTDTLVIKNMRLTGNSPDDCKTAKIADGAPHIDSLWIKYCNLYGEEKALEIGRKICEVANADYEYGSKVLKGSEANKYWKSIAQQAEEKFGIKLGWGIASKGQLILLAAYKLGYPVDVIEV